MKGIKKGNKGFTLLELLVVILIIGILAAIALPQYRRAKEKSEASELLINVKALHEAQQRYYLANGTFATNFDDLDINLSGYERGGCEDFETFHNKNDCLSNNKNIIFIQNDGANLISLRKTGKYQKSGFSFREIVTDARPENKLLCYEYNMSGFCSELLKCDSIVYVPNNINGFYSCNL